jgi:hypothetical protein
MRDTCLIKYHNIEVTGASHADTIEYNYIVARCSSGIFASLLCETRAQSIKENAIASNYSKHAFAVESPRNILFFVGVECTSHMQ